MPKILFRSVTKSELIQPLIGSNHFELTFECLEEVDQIEVEVTYSVDVQSSDRDQRLALVEVGPIPRGTIAFGVDTASVDIDHLEHIFGITSIIISCKYSGQQFVRIGYIANVFYPGVEQSALASPRADDSLVEEDDIGEDDESDDTASCDYEDFEDEAVNDAHPCDETAVRDDANRSPGVVFDEETVTVNGHVLKKSDIMIDVKEEPVVTVFDIDWGDESLSSDGSSRGDTDE